MQNSNNVLKFYSCKIVIDGEDYSWTFNRVRITSSFDTPYPIISLQGDIDAIDILKNKLFGSKDIKLTIYSFGPHEELITNAQMDLVQISDSNMVPSRTNNINQGFIIAKAYEALLVPKQAFQGISTYVNYSKSNVTLSDVIYDLCQQVKLNYMGPLGSGDILNPNVCEQLLIPPQSFCTALRELQSTAGLVSGILKWTTNYKSDFLITDAAKLYKQWTKPLHFYLPANAEQTTTLIQQGADTVTQQQKYIIAYDIEVLNATQTTGSCVRGKQIWGNFPDDKLFEIQSIDTSTEIKQYGISPTKPPFNKAIQQTRKIDWTIGNDIISLRTELSTEAIKSYILKIVPLSITDIKPFLFDRNSYSFIANIYTKIPDYVPINGSYFINACDLEFIKMQQEHWVCKPTLILQRSTPSKV